jgi:eukaryotic-like serine/threonine-protein kinase
MKLVPDEFTGRTYGKYEVLCRLAVGGMAEIFLGFSRSGAFANRPVVLKNILPEQREDPIALRMLLDEARVTATLSHQNIAQVLDLERAGEDFLMVIEFIRGANLEEIIEAWTKQGEAVPLGYALTVIREAAQGLLHAHQHKDARGQGQPIVHRDVTPRNIMTDFDGATKMLDFGIARAMGAQRRTVAGMVRGTTAYMSPEQAVGKDLDPRSDLFSLGVIFHELVTGQRLFQRSNAGNEMAAVYDSEIPPPSKVNRRVPKALDSVVMMALERNREKRYQNAGDLIRELSLAAGPLAWSKERCAEMVKERFAERLRNIEKLLKTVPNEGEGSTDRHTAMSAPSEGPTVMVQRPTAPLRPLEFDDSPALTMVDSGPAIDEIREQRKQDDLPSDEPKPSWQVQQLAKVSNTLQPPPTRQRQQAPVTENPFGDLEDGANPTRVVKGARLLPRSSNPPVPTDPSFEAFDRRKEASRTPIVIAALVALVLGATGGVFLFSRISKREVGALGRLSVRCDRPVSVILKGQALGQTPLESWVPAGHHAFELKEADGTTRALAVDVAPGQQVVKDVVFDALPKVR